MRDMKPVKIPFLSFEKIPLSWSFWIWKSFCSGPFAFEAWTFQTFRNHQNMALMFLDSWLWNKTIFKCAYTLPTSLNKKKEKQIELLTPSFPSSLTWVLFTKAESVSHGLLSRKHVCLEQFRLGSGRFLLTDMNLRICKKGSLSFFPSYRFILRRFSVKVSLNHYSNHYHVPTEIKSKVPWLFLDICMVPRCLATCILF